MVEIDPKIKVKSTGDVSVRLFYLCVDADPLYSYDANHPVTLRGCRIAGQSYGLWSNSEVEDGAALGLIYG